MAPSTEPVPGARPAAGAVAAACLDSLGIGALLAAFRHGATGRPGLERWLLRLSLCLGLALLLVLLPLPASIPWGSGPCWRLLGMARRAGQGWNDGSFD